MNSELNEPEWLTRIIEQVCHEKGFPVPTLRRMLAKVEEHSEDLHADGLRDSLLQILQQDLAQSKPQPEP